MGTRGLYGFRKNGMDKTTYNHFDSYPSWLGLNIAEFCCKHSIEDMHKIFDGIVLVDRNSTPTEEQIDDCIQNGFCNLSVSSRSEADWYCLLRNCQGDLEALANAKRNIYMEDKHEFIKDSLWCDYAYIINLDDGVLEYWKGFQKTPQEGNRYGAESHDDYYPCKLVLTFPLSEINDPRHIVRMMECGENIEHLQEIAGQYTHYNLTLEEAYELGDKKIINIWDNIYEAVNYQARKEGCLDDSNQEDFNYELYGKDMMSEGKYLMLKSGRVIRYED